jgi:hypothetical protein
MMKDILGGTLDERWVDQVYRPMKTLMEWKLE